MTSKNNKTASLFAVKLSSDLDIPAETIHRAMDRLAESGYSYEYGLTHMPVNYQAMVSLEAKRMVAKIEVV